MVKSFLTLKAHDRVMQDERGKCRVCDGIEDELIKDL